jgi:hypothetical protein
MCCFIFISKVKMKRIWKILQYYEIEMILILSDKKRVVIDPKYYVHLKTLGQLDDCTSESKGMISIPFDKCTLNVVLKVCNDEPVDFETMDHILLFKVANAADFFAYAKLLHVTTSEIAKRLQWMEPVQIAKYLNEQNDICEEDKQKIENNDMRDAIFKSVLR